MRCALAGLAVCRATAGGGELGRRDRMAPRSSSVMPRYFMCISQTRRSVESSICGASEAHIDGLAGSPAAPRASARQPLVMLLCWR